MPINSVIVLGMHRSGTSAMARLVQELGLRLGTNLLGAASGNIYGHFEDAAFIEFHDALIARYFPKLAPFCEWLPLADAEFVYTDADRAQAKTIWSAHRISGSSAWKDPRTSLFLDLWAETVPDAKIVVCLRHPYQVHRSLLRRGESFLHVDYSAAIVGWTIYNQRILRALSALPKERYVVLDVEAAFREPRELTEGLSRFLGLPVSPTAHEAIAPEVFNFGEDDAGAMEDFESFLPEAGATYRQLRQLDFLHPFTAADPTGSPSPIKSEEARLIEFEETHDLRARAKAMLVRSISVDLQRTTELFEKMKTAGTEKDLLIDDLTRLTEQLKKLVRIPPQPPA